MTNPLIRQTLKLLPAKSSSVMKAFAEKLLERVPDEDLKQIDSKVLAKVIESQWDLIKSKKTNKPSIRVYTPTAEKDGWTINRTIIDIVQDDMAFLIDSIVAEIVRHGQLIHMLTHPTLHIEYDKKGEFKSFKNDPEEGLKRYSFSHIELRGIISEAQAEELRMGLLAVMDDVRNATRDWLPMKDMLREAQRQLSNAPAKYDDHLVEEYQAFLEYLYDNNFTLLGYREYKFSTGKDGKLTSQTVAKKSLGLLRDEVMPVYLNDARECLSEPQQKLRRGQPPLTIAKVNRRSTVHRRVPMDAVAVKLFDKKGNVTGEMLFVGLFTSVTYSRSVGDIPYLRVKVQNVINRTQFLPGSHDRRALRHILEKYPRDEVLQMPEDLLYEHATSILRLQERPRIALYMRTDPFGRYISCLVYVPRDRYETRLRLRLQHTLEQELGGQCTNYQVTQDDSPLARVMYLVDINHLKTAPKYDVEAIEAKLDDAGRVWAERLRDALEASMKDQSETSNIIQKFGNAFPVSYHEQYEPRQAVHDIRKIEEVLKFHNIALDLYRSHDCTDAQVRLKIYSPEKPMTLSDVLPMLEKMGLRIISELPFEVQPAHAHKKVFIHDFLMETDSTQSKVSIHDIKSVFEDAFDKIWNHEMENDGLNKLVINARMNWREITILRTYLRYLRQVGLHYSREFIENTLADNPAITVSVVKLFKSLFDPNLKGQNEVFAAGCAVEIDHAMESVVSLDQDKVLRSLTAVVNATLRTNFFQTDAHGKYKPYISIKLDSRKIDDLPEPRPFREIWVYSPRTEGIHLRMDKISRGGIRWSDRHEDFRTEVLGLMKAQQVKNSVIVPMGAKGGFVVKQPPKEGGRPAYLAEGIECYKIFIRGLLDITDNQHGDKVTPPKNVLRRDADDPYLVVAADKGTATFSDIANALSIEYGHWLGDAFASGGSAGYDHKKMGITARGAWESVKRHFRELNHDIQTQDFDVVGVGDMGGDVFGNGMLLSEHIRLIGAFNHLHIFCDPDPDIKATFKERQRLFNDVKGWDEYNQKLLSKGGKIFNRSEKSLQLTPEIMKRFDIARERVTPNELIQALLKARTDLLWVGGIGTYIKSSKETHGDVGDKSNDALRINGNEVRAKVMGEGANLAITQKGRIEYAENGGRLNADFIDNSGGVDSSDHEVNIKILMNEIMRRKANNMDVKKRDKFLASMTDEVAALVLRNNYQQSQAISLMELQTVDNLAEQAALIADLERKTGLNRALESLPDEETIQARMRAGHGLTRPELAILQAHAKIAFTWDLLDSDIPDSKAMEGRLMRYFPTKLSENYPKEIKAHRLKREIICTTLASSMINRMGPTFVRECMQKGNSTTAEVAKAYVIVRESFGLRTLWGQIEALDSKVPAMVQLKAYRDIAHMTERAMTWFLNRLGRNLDINSDIAVFEQPIATLRKNFDAALTPHLLADVQQKTRAGISEGMTESLAHDIALMPLLASSCDIIRIGLAEKTDLPVIAKIYFELGEHFHLDWMRTQAGYLPANDRWSAEAVGGVVDNLYSVQAGLTVKILQDMKGLPAKKPGKTSIVDEWMAQHGTQATMLEPLFADLRKAGNVDLAMLIIAEQKLRNLYGG